MTTINALGELVRRPFVFAIQSSKIKSVDRVSIERGLAFLDQSVVPIDPHRPVVVRDGKGEDLAVELLLALHQLE